METAKAYRATILLAFFAGISFVLSYALRIFYARIFTPAEYGLLYAAIAFLTIVAVVRNFGLGDAITFYTAKQDKNTVSFVKIGLLVQIVLGALLFILVIMFSGQIAATLFQSNNQLLLIVFAAAFTIVGFSEIFVAYFRGAQRYKIFGLAEPLRLLFVLACSILCLLFYKSVLAAAVAWLVAYTLFSLLYTGLFFKTVKLSAFNVAAMNSLLSKRLFKYSFPSLLSAAGLLLFYNVDTLLITYMLGTYFAGLYNAAVPVANILLLVSLPASLVLFPAVSKLWHSRKPVQPLLDTMYSFSFIAALLLAIILGLFSTAFITVFFGTAYIAAASAVMFLIAAAVVRVLVELQLSVLAGIGAVRSRAYLLYIGLAINVVLNIVFIHYFGIAGAAGAMALSFLALFLLAQLVLRSHKITFPYLRLASILVLSAVFFAALSLLHLTPPTFLTLLIYSVLVAILYAGWLMLWRIVTVADAQKLISFIRK